MLAYAPSAAGAVPIMSTVEKEWHWLLQNHVPYKLTLIARLLDQLIAILRSKDVTTCPISGDLIRGFITLAGPRIIKSELMLRIPQKGTTLTKVAVNPAAPLLLPQLTEFDAFLTQIRSAVADGQALLAGALLGTGDSAARAAAAAAGGAAAAFVPSRVLPPDDVTRAVRTLCAHAERAVPLLDAPDPLARFPYQACRGAVHFQPPLPDELCVEFCVTQREYLAVRATHVAFRSDPSAAAAASGPNALFKDIRNQLLSGLTGGSSSSSASAASAFAAAAAASGHGGGAAANGRGGMDAAAAGPTHERLPTLYKGRPYSVVENIQTNVASPMLARIDALWNEALHEIRALNDKVLVLRRLDTIYA
ncbi:hypothetical protein CXG81DRAFT_25428 [Caulochytrium protostelioides]|uniref:Uncharacterized protein n=1 Tax=Caulochytrium protostelioides TaxID=1555241 RepID=A0A4P9X9F5_9FUNG|nr:hypothetical protein CXG81DRAFT_25428 [Caulochytrium protostelioides]|eukprot:RKP01938.1 hypothetical protein CXG81DRAFT_25428 [Caulochytrium protostelioides]